MKTLVKYGSSAIVLSSFVVACSANPTETKTEKTGTTTEALGEAACGTNTLTALVPSFGTASASEGAIVKDPSYHCFWNDTVSSTSSYGSAGCDSQFIVEVGVPYPSWKVSAGRFAINPVQSLDEASCAKAHETLGAYGHDASGWHNIGSYVGHGQWSVGGGFIPPHCEFVTEVNTIPTWFEGNKYDKVRAAASLYTIELLKGSPYNSYLPVTTGITGGNGC